MSRIKLLKNGNIAEESIHKSLLSYISQHPYLFKFKKLFLHIPNEDKCNPRYGSLMKSLGMRKGAADLFVATPRRGFGGAWIELKSQNGVLSSDQMQFLADMREQNFYVCACWSLDEAIETVEWYFEV